MVERVLLDAGTLARRLDELAVELAGAASAGWLWLGLLDGAAVVVGELRRRLAEPVEVAWLRVASYHGGLQSSGTVAICGPLPVVAGRRVLVVDDILDSGRTLATVAARLMAAGALEVRTCVLLAKDCPRVVEVRADHVGFSIGDEFVVGFGMDFRGEFRDLPMVGVLGGVGG